MLKLTIRTDKSKVELGLFDNNKKLGYETWDAGRELSKGLHKATLSFLGKHDKSWEDIGGIVVFKGPGSFTGLRIGLTVGNTLADGLGVPIVGTLGSGWIQKGLRKLKNGENEIIILPKYGTPINISLPRK